MINYARSSFVLGFGCRKRLKKVRAEIWTGKKKGLVFHRGEREKVKEIWRAEMENFPEGKEAGNSGVCAVRA